MTGQLSGRVALVTGASSGIGEGIALALAEAGAAVALVARRIDRLESLVERINSKGGTAIAIPADMTNEADADLVVRETVSSLGKLDILINSAGIMRVGGVAGANLAEFRQVYDINVFGTLYACAAAVPRMLEQGGGDIINITSLAARKGGPDTNAYSGSKRAANAMTDSMRQELGGRNIRVSILMPGATASEVGDSITDPNWRSAIQAHVAKDGAVQPHEIGETVVFMLSLPRHVNVSEIAVRPTIDVTA